MRRPLTVACILLLLASGGTTADDAAADAAADGDAPPPGLPCQATHVAGVGWTCPAPGGLLEVFARDSSSLGTTHGPDPLPNTGPQHDAITGAADDALTPRLAAAPRYPACVDSAYGADYAVQVIYARAHDDTDQFASLLPSLRDQLYRANGQLYADGIATGAGIDLRVRCAGGIVDVRNEVLPTSRANAQFSTIVEDLRDAGYTSGKVKHWVYYDDRSACGGCAGVGHIYGDDRASSANWNNGNGGALFAVNFAYGWTVGLHELGHNMGAVQDSAPHSTGAGHCTDGRDIMCYNDGGPNGNQYSTGHCNGTPFDCGHDDYFHASPAAGTYLADHWNIAHQRNRFIVRGAAEQSPETSVGAWSCPGTVEVGANTDCIVQAIDATAPGVWAQVAWGDGTTQRFPATGTWSSGDVHTVTHQYASPATRTATVTVHGDDDPAQASETIRVVADRTPPAITMDLPRPDHIYVGCSEATPTGVPALGRPLLIDQGCFEISATDGGRVVRIDVFVDNQRVARFDDPAPTVSGTFALPSGYGGGTITVQALDAAGNKNTALQPFQSAA